MRVWRCKRGAILLLLQQTKPIRSPKSHLQAAVFHPVGVSDRDDPDISHFLDIGWALW